MYQFRFACCVRAINAPMADFEKNIAENLSENQKKYFSFEKKYVIMKANNGSCTKQKCKIPRKDHLI